MLNTPFPCLCNTNHHECCRYFCAWASLSCILNTLFSKRWLPTLCIHSFIHKKSFHQYSMCTTTFSLSLTLCCCSLKFFTVQNYTKNILKYSSSINIGGIANITFAPQNTITSYEKAKIVSQYSCTQIDDGKHTASLTPHYKFIPLLNFWRFIWVCVTKSFEVEC
jgi:hypothetical protein